jgi:hypothetical protein
MAKAASKIDKIAAKAASGKNTKLKGKYSEMDLKATGKLPEWADQDRLTPEQFKARWRQARYFYYYHHDIKELRPFIVAVYGKDWSKKQIKDFNKLKDWQISIPLATACKVHLDGAKWEDETKEFCDRKVAELLKAGAGIADEEDKPKEEPKRVIGIQDRLKDIKNDIIGELEELEDGFITTGKLPNVNIMNWLRGKSVPQQIIPDMIDYYAQRLAFMLEVKEGKDAQLKEGYAHLKKKDVDNWIKWYNDIVTDLDGYKRAKVATRKPRARKPVSPEKLTRKLKYAKDFAELGLTSIAPKDIVGATTLWVYNTKTRKLGVYHASTIDQQLSVKGSTIVGWDPKISVAKTLRKPAEQIKAFKDSGKVQLRTFLSKIKATEIKLNGRINADTILLRTDK